MNDSTENTTTIDFQGFSAPKKNYFQMPNEWINICAGIKSLAELKVIQYVLRHTWGYHEYDIHKAITIDEFMHGRKRNDQSRIDNGTGLSNRSVIDGIENAIIDGFLTCVIDDSDKGRIVKYYALKMVTDELAVKNLHSNASCEDSSQQGCKSFTSGVKELHSNSEESSQRTEKDTSEKHSRKNTERKTSISSNNSQSTTFDANASSLTQLSSEALIEELQRRGLSLSSVNVTSNTTSQHQQDTMKQPEMVSPIVPSTTENAVQATLIERPAKPEMPSASMQWGAEKLVQITEAKRLVKGKDCNQVGAYFLTTATGKSGKSQRQRQLDAAKKIIEQEVTEEQYIRAFDDCNDAWWLDVRKSPLMVEDMAAKTKRTNTMRTLEILEKLASMPQSKQRPSTAVPGAASGATRTASSEKRIVDIEQIKDEKFIEGLVHAVETGEITEEEARSDAALLNLTLPAFFPRVPALAMASGGAR